MPGMKTELLDRWDDIEYEVLPGITLIETPGHSKGHLSAIVRPGDDARRWSFRSTSPTCATTSKTRC